MMNNCWYQAKATNCKLITLSWSIYTVGTPTATSKQSSNLRICIWLCYSATQCFNTGIFLPQLAPDASIINPSQASWAGSYKQYRNHCPPWKPSFNISSNIMGTTIPSTTTDCFFWQHAQLLPVILNQHFQPVLSGGFCTIVAHPPFLASNLPGISLTIISHY